MTDRPTLSPSDRTALRAHMAWLKVKIGGCALCLMTAGGLIGGGVGAVGGLVVAGVFVALATRNPSGPSDVFVPTQSAKEAPDDHNA